MIKADMWSDEKIGKLTHLERLLFIGVWNFCDDSGVCRANLLYLRNNIFPYDDLALKDIQLALKNIAKLNLIQLLNSKEESYLKVNNFSKHQKINRPSSFRYITGEHTVEPVISGKSDAISEGSLSTQVVLTEYSLPKEKEKEKEKDVYKIEFEKVWRSELCVYAEGRNKKPKSLANWIHARSVLSANDIIKAWRVYKSSFKDSSDAGGFCFHGTIDNLKGWLEACSATKSEGINFDNYEKSLSKQREKNNSLRGAVV
jgi:hypothetical protein